MERKYRLTNIVIHYEKHGVKITHNHELNQEIETLMMRAVKQSLKFAIDTLLNVHCEIYFTYDEVL